MEIAIAATMVVAGLFFFLCGAAVGMRYERMGWNKLIEEGKIPKPVRTTVKK